VTETPLDFDEALGGTFALDAPMTVRLEELDDES
jgi:hypothetical protein